MMVNSLILFLTFLAASLGTITGFGTSTILVPILSLQFPLAETLLFVGIIHWFGDIWKMLFFKKGFNLKLVLLFGGAGILMSFVGAKMVNLFPEELMRKLLGGFLLAYVFFLLKNPRWQLPRTNFNALTGGFLSGFFSGIFGVGGAIRSTFLSAYNLDKAVFIFTSGMIGLLIDSSRLIGYLSGGIKLSVYSPVLLIGAILFSLAGAFVAKKVVKLVPQKHFRWVVATGLFLVGIRYLLF